MEKKNQDKEAALAAKKEAAKAAKEAKLRKKMEKQEKKKVRMAAEAKGDQKPKKQESKDPKVKQAKAEVQKDSGVLPHDFLNKVRQYKEIDSNTIFSKYGEVKNSNKSSPKYPTISSSLASEFQATTSLERQR